MDVLEEFDRITTEYERELFNIFKDVIDSAVNYSIEQNMNPLDSYVCVNDAVENTYKKLAYIQGYAPSPYVPYKANPVLSDHLTEKIYQYMEPITNKAREVLQQEIDNIVSSSTIGELMEKLEEFKMKLEERDIDSSIYEDLDIKKRV